MTFEEYAQKHLGTAGLSFEGIELVRMGWNAARAQSGKGAEPVARHHATVCYEDCLCEHGSGCKLEAECGAQPQPAQQGSVPSRDDLIQCLLATQRQSEGVMADAILSMFAAAPAASAVQGDGWVKCSERLPTDYQSVLVASNTGSIYTCTKSVIERKNSEPDTPQIRRERFTHWMPLPQPPKEGSGDE